MELVKNKLLWILKQVQNDKGRKSHPELVSGSNYIKIAISFILLFSFSLNCIPHYYATSADSKFYNKVVNLVNYLSKNDANNFTKIAIFDLGFTTDQRSYLEALDKVVVCDLEKKHSDLLKYFVTSRGGRKVRGWFAWKPVAIKQALDMFPYVLYLDSAMEVYKPLDNLFKHIEQNGYFLLDCGDLKENSLPFRINKKVVEKLIDILGPAYKKMLLSTDTRMISAGIQGLSRKYLNNYVLPVYNLVKDIDLFADDGTAKLGFGAARHDQAPFSIFAHLNGMHINRAGWQNIVVDGKRVPFHCHWNRKELNEYSALKY